MRTGLSLLLLLLIGCCKPETIIRPETINVPVPVIVDTVLVAYSDTVLVQGEKVVKTDTVILIKYFPIEKKFYLKVKPDTVRITRQDTVQVIKQQIIETPLLSKIGLVAIGLILGISIIVLRKFIL